MKFAAAMLAVIVCSLTGSYFTSRDITRVRTIEEILIFIRIISTEIKFSKDPIDLIIRRISRRNEYRQLTFISDCVKMLESESLPDAWRTSLEKSKIHKSDKEILLSLGANLGTSDVEGQLSNCELHGKLLESNLKKAREKSSQFGKLYTSLGVLGGFLIAVLLI